MNKPTFFFVAFTKVQKHQTSLFLRDLKSLAPTAKVEAATSMANPFNVTYIATFEEPVDFAKLAEDFKAGKQVLRVFHSRQEKPTYFYAAHVVHDLKPAQKLRGDLVTRNQALLCTLVPLITPLHLFNLTPAQTSVLIESFDHDFRKEDIVNINKTLRTIPHSAFFATRTEEV